MGLIPFLFTFCAEKISCSGTMSSRFGRWVISEAIIIYVWPDALFLFCVPMIKDWKLHPVVFMLLLWSGITPISNLFATYLNYIWTRTFNWFLVQNAQAVVVMFLSKKKMFSCSITFAHLFDFLTKSYKNQMMVGERLVVLFKPGFGIFFNCITQDRMCFQ